MKNNKIQCILCLVISVLCWSNVFGESEKMLTDSVCWNYQIEVSAEPTTLYMNIYNVTDFEPYTPDVVEWYSPDWQLDFGDSATVVYELDVNFPPSFEMLICADYEVDGEFCTVCEWVFVGDVNSCEYELELNTEGMTVFGSVINTIHYCPPTDVTWILEGGGGVIGTELSLFYQFDELGEYLICAEYSDNILGCEGVICDTIVIDGESTIDCEADFEIEHFVEYNWAGFYLYNSNYFLSVDSIAWYIDGQFVEYGIQMDYEFAVAGTYTVCAVASSIVNVATGEICPSAEVCIDVEIINQQSDCEGINFEYDIDGSSGLFGLFYPDIYEVDEDSVVWYIDGQFLEYGNAVDYDFPDAGESYEVCAVFSAYNSITEVWCPLEICHQVWIACPFATVEYDALNDSTLIFNASIEAPYELDSLIWYVSGANAYELGNPLTYTFPESGSYYVCFLGYISDQTDSWLCQNESCVSFDIEIDNQQDDCEAFFEWQDNGNVNGMNTVTFANVSNGNYSKMSWDFGDGNTSAYSGQDSFEHIYENIGVYNVCLTVFDNVGCQSTHCEIVLVTGTPISECDYEIEYDVVGSDSFIFTLYSPSNSGGEALWLNFETGENYGIGDSIFITFDEPGVYEVCATVGHPTDLCGFGGLVLCETITVQNSACENTDCVFPGDADRNMVADNYDILPIGLHFGETGPVRSDATIGWYGQPAPDWQISADSLSLKHVDTNGDGEIYFDDVDAIEQNYNRTHDGVYAMRVEGAPGLHLEFDLDTIYSAPDTGTIIINADIIMGTANLPVEGVYGVAFSIGYSADLVDTNTVAADYFTGSWIGNPTTVLQLEKNVINESVIDFGYSRTDQQNISGFGQIGSVSFVMTDNIIGKLASEIELNFPITNVRAIDNTGEEIVITGSDNAVVLDLGNTTTTVENPDLSQNINIFPNPTTNTINMTISDLQAQTVILYNAVGQRVLARQIAATDIQIDVRHLPSGVYLVSVQTEKGIYNQRIIVK